MLFIAAQVLHCSHMWQRFKKKNTQSSRSAHNVHFSTQVLLPALTIFTHTIMHLVYPPKFYITIVSNFSWRKWRLCLCNIWRGGGGGGLGKQNALRTQWRLWLMQCVILENFIISAYLLYINTEGGFRGGPRGPQHPPFCPGIFSFVNVC